MILKLLSLIHIYSVRSLIEMQTADYPDYEVEKEQQKLNALYDTFSKQYGLINSRANVSAFSQDSSFALLSALEVLDDNGELERKADMLSLIHIWTQF